LIHGFLNYFVSANIKKICFGKKKMKIARFIPVSRNLFRLLVFPNKIQGRTIILKLIFSKKFLSWFYQKTNFNTASASK